ncbi:MAG: hypothetical protein RML15_00455 [Bacteroidota bacterium]|nr:hypothetical protein [Candidatus Kapabacteria bacterium]MCS7302114.1 hypothetical protein [Candidatus Kapabacteria bacterium]MCX7936494.1 hypothetical protein [Chlorobiota bacterium]MDW8074655.1 hypothetical protein [Bacteroidota bacterium]MDW8270869.1 hypothetical protein [Bacteroidota bacterium]
MNARTNPQAPEHTLYKASVVHYVVFFAIFFATAAIFHKLLLVRLVEGFVIFQFKPEREQLADFNGVKAVPTAEGQKHIGEEVKREFIKPDYIFDFTNKARQEKVHGYTKAPDEWVVKAPKLGDDPIYLDPNVGFIIFSVDIGFVIAVLVTLVLPPSIGIMSLKVEREIHNNKAKVRLQTGFSEDIIELLVMPDDRLAALAESDRRRIVEAFRIVWNRTIPEEEVGGSQRHAVSFDEVFDRNTDPVAFRNNLLYIRIREHFSEFVEKSIEDLKDALNWQRNRFRIGAALRLYMAHHFTEQYSNNVTGLAYGGAALLIVAVGIRGLKFIPPTRPSLILGAIFLEFSMLVLLAFTLLYTEEEERMDKMLKKMEDASRSQLDILQEQQRDIRLFVDKLIGESSEMIKRRVEEAISQHLSNDEAMREKISKAIVENLKIGFKEQLNR